MLSGSDIASTVATNVVTNAVTTSSANQKTTGPQAGSPALYNLLASHASTIELAAGVVVGGAILTYAGVNLGIKLYRKSVETEFLKKIEVINGLHKTYLVKIPIPEKNDTLSLPPVFTVDEKDDDNGKVVSVDAIHFTDSILRSKGKKIPRGTTLALTQYKESIFNAILHLKSYYFTVNVADKKKNDVREKGGIKRALISYLIEILDSHCFKFQGYDYDIAVLGALGQFINAYASLQGKNTAAYSRLSRVYPEIVSAKKQLEMHKDALSLQEIVNDLNVDCRDLGDNFLRHFAAITNKNEHRDIISNATKKIFSRALLQEHYLDTYLKFTVNVNEITILKSPYSNCLIQFSKFALDVLDQDKVLEEKMIPQVDIVVPDIEMLKNLEEAKDLSKEDEERKSKIKKEIANIETTFSHCKNYLTKEVLCEQNKEPVFVSITKKELLVERTKMISNYAHLIKNILMLQYYTNKLNEGLELLGAIEITSKNHSNTLNTIMKIFKEVLEKIKTISSDHQAIDNANQNHMDERVEVELKEVSESSLKMAKVCIENSQNKMMAYWIKSQDTEQLKATATKNLDAAASLINHTLSRTTDSTSTNGEINNPLQIEPKSDLPVIKEKTSYQPAESSSRRVSSDNASVSRMTINEDDQSSSQNSSKHEKLKKGKKKSSRIKIPRLKKNKKHSMSPLNSPHENYPVIESLVNSSEDVHGKEPKYKNMPSLTSKSTTSFEDETIFPANQGFLDEEIEMLVLNNSSGSQVEEIEISLKHAKSEKSSLTKKLVNGIAKTMQSSSTSPKKETGEFLSSSSESMCEKKLKNSKKGNSLGSDQAAEKDSEIQKLNNIVREREEEIARLNKLLETKKEKPEKIYSFSGSESKSNISKLDNNQKTAFLDLFKIDTQDELRSAIVKLKDQGISVDKVKNDYDQTWLFHYVKNGKEDLADILVDNGADSLLLNGACSLMLSNEKPVRDYTYILIKNAAKQWELKYYEQSNGNPEKVDIKNVPGLDKLLDNLDESDKDFKDKIQAQINIHYKKCYKHTSLILIAKKVDIQRYEKGSYNYPLFTKMLSEVHGLVMSWLDEMIKKDIAATAYPVLFDFITTFVVPLRDHLKTYCDGLENRNKGWFHGYWCPPRAQELANIYQALSDAIKSRNFEVMLKRLSEIDKNVEIRNSSQLHVGLRTILKNAVEWSNNPLMFNCFIEECYQLRASLNGKTNNSEHDPRPIPKTTATVSTNGMFSSNISTKSRNTRQHANTNEAPIKQASPK